MRSFSILALACLFVLSACKKGKEQPATPLPPAGADITRTFYYPAANNTETAEYSIQHDSIIAAANINATKQLVISFDVPYAHGNDFIQLTIDADDIMPGYTGNYLIIHSELSGLRGDVQVNYRYKRGEFSYVEFLPGNADGNLQITAYDKKQKLIKGTYSFHINSFHDPKVGMNWVETKIDVEGSFENLQIK